MIFVSWRPMSSVTDAVDSVLLGGRDRDELLHLPKQVSPEKLEIRLHSPRVQCVWEYVRIRKWGVVALVPFKMYMIYASPSYAPRLVLF